jgi:hypothetical protein
LIGAAFYAAVAVWLLLDRRLDGSHSRTLAEAVGTWIPISGTGLYVLTLLSLYVLRLTSIQPLCRLTKRRFPSVAASSAVLGAGLLWLMFGAGLLPVLASEPFRAELRWVALVLTPAVVALALAELCPKSLHALPLAHQEAHGPLKSRWWSGFGRHTVSDLIEAIGSWPLVGAAAMAVLMHSAHGAWQTAQLKRDSVGATGFRLELRGFDLRTFEPISHVGGILRAYRYVDMEGDRYEAGPGLSVIARKGAALANERWTVSKTVVGVSRKGEIRAIRLTLVDHLPGGVKADLVFDIRDEKGIQEFLPERFGTPRERIGRKYIAREEARGFEREVFDGEPLALASKGESCQSVRMRSIPMQHILEWQSWQLMPVGGLDADFACSDRYVVFAAWSMGTAKVTVASEDGRDIFGFDLETSRNWRDRSVTLGRVRVDAEDVRFELQEWETVVLPDFTRVTKPTRRLAYRIPRAATQPPAS